MKTMLGCFLDGLPPDSQPKGFCSLFPQREPRQRAGNAENATIEATLGICMMKTAKNRVVAGSAGCYQYSVSMCWNFSCLILRLGEARDPDRHLGSQHAIPSTGIGVMPSLAMFKSRASLEQLHCARLASRGAEPESPSDTRTNQGNRNTTRMAQAHRCLDSSAFSHRFAIACRGHGIDSIARGWRNIKSDGVLCSYCPPTCTQRPSDDNASSDNHAIHHSHVRISRTADPDQAHGWQLCKPTRFEACEED